MNISGLTRDQASALLSRLYATYLKRPIVSIAVAQPRPLNIAISGEVGNPGSYSIPLSQGQKAPVITDVIQLAGGLTTVSDISQVQIRRFVQKQQQVITLNLWDLIQNANMAQNISLRDGDQIFIPTRENPDLVETLQIVDANFGVAANKELNVAVIGEVNRPGTYKFVPETSQGTGAAQRQQPPRLSFALQQAGGIKPLADIRQVEVRRFNRDGSQQVISVDLWQLLQTGDLSQDIVLQQGDAIFVPTAVELAPQEAETLAIASFAPETINVNVVGEVIKPGVVELQPNTPLNQAILAAGGFNRRRANETQVTLIRLNPDGTVTKRDIPIDLAQGITNENNPALRNNDVIIVDRSGLTAATDTVTAIFSPLGSIFGLVNFFRIFGLGE